MTTKLLAVIAEAATAPACLDAAEAAGHAIRDASIEALHVVVDPANLITAPEEIAIQSLRDRYEGTAREREAETHAAYQSWINDHPDADIPLRWKERFGSEEQNLESEARIFDVLVLARPTNMDGGDALHAAFRRVRHPFFLVPSKWRFNYRQSFAEHIVVAWNETGPCRKALVGALPWLRVARKVTLLRIAKSPELAGSAEDLLDLHGIHYGVHLVQRDSHSLGDQIVSEARCLGADLLVMGAYRRNEFIEWLLGGTTRHALACCDLPLFLAH
ncbi:universal stress protein (plasmid) [Novosphingobium sp. BL-8A]|uniref:universal stress protein n=1 Tax=Novosphingobium sp. BL-8A TaxID=3127639 RepID=UPI003756AED0